MDARPLGRIALLLPFACLAASLVGPTQAHAFGVPPLHVPKQQVTPPVPITVVTPLPKAIPDPKVSAPTPTGPTGWTYGGPPVGPTSFVRTPEPGTLLSGLVGLGVLAWYRRRRTPPVQLT
jgi:hypothetical protein